MTETLVALAPVAPSSTQEYPVVQDKLTTEQAAKHIGVKPETLRRMCRRGEIAFYAMPSGNYFDRADLDAWIASRRREPKRKEPPSAEE